MKTTLNRQELIEYIKHAAELESSIQRQEECIQLAKSSLSMPKVKRVKAERPSEPQLILPEEPKKTVELKKELELPLNLCGAIDILALLVTFFFVKPFSIMDTLTSVAPFIIPSFIFFVLVGVIAYVRKYKIYKDQHAKWKIEVEEAKRSYEAAQADYSTVIANYESEKEKAEHENRKRKKTAEEAYKKVQSEIASMDDPLKETKRLLKQLYSVNFVYPKYRNMIAMCTMYEYLASGRCEMLAGPQGAYNLYEAEIRQNTIISQLDDISSSLNDIKRTQYKLYVEVTKTSKALYKISDNMKAVQNSLNRIGEDVHAVAELSAITAMNSAITAKNTEDLKYINLITQ